MFSERSSGFSKQGPAWIQWIAVARALLVGILCCALALLASAWLLCRWDLPSFTAGLFATGAVSLGTMIAAMSLAYSAKQKGLVLGLMCGAFFFAVFAAAAVMMGQRQFGTASWIRMACFLLSGGLGGYLGLILSERPHTPRKL